MNSKEPAAVGNYTSLQRRSKQGKEKKKYYLIYYKNGVLLKGWLLWSQTHSSQAPITPKKLGLKKKTINTNQVGFTLQLILLKNPKPLGFPVLVYTLKAWEMRETMCTHLSSPHGTFHPTSIQQKER